MSDPKAPRPPAARPGERTVIHVRPEEIVQPGERRRPRWRDASFFAPVAAVVALSTLIVYGVLAIGAVLLSALRPH